MPARCRTAVRRERFGWVPDKAENRNVVSLARPRGGVKPSKQARFALVRTRRAAERIAAFQFVSALHANAMDAIAAPGLHARAARTDRPADQLAG